MTATRPLIPLETMPPAEVAAKLHDAAVKIIYARAHAESEREKAEARAAEIFATRESWPIDPYWKEIVPSHSGVANARGDVALMSDDDSEEWYQLYHSALIAEGYSDISIGECPASLLERDVWEAEIQLMDLAQPWTTINYENLYFDDRREYIELLIQTGLAHAPQTKDLI